MKPAHSSEAPGYEPTDASPRVVLLTAAALIVGVALSLLIAAGFYVRRYGPSRADGRAPRETSFREGPTQRTSIESEWAQLQADTRPHLEEYGWVDRSKGIVHLPVARAMELLAKEHSSDPKEGTAR